MIKSLLRNLHRYVFWALISVMLWAWIFTLLLSAPEKNKITIYADVPEVDGNALSIELEKDLPKGIRLVDAKTFNSLLFQQYAVLKGDLYLVPESDAETYLPSFLPIDRAAFPGAAFYESDGEAYGIVLYDEQAGLITGGRYVTYKEGERCFLFFNKDSKHLGAWNGSADDAAIVIAQNFLKLGQEEDENEKEVDGIAAGGYDADGLRGKDDRGFERDPDGKDRGKHVIREKGRESARRVYYGYGRVVRHCGGTERREVL